jgi:Tol biopolymer transport system component
MALQPGAILGPYEILALIGAGGMGEVYRARDTRLDRVVAIKIISGGDAASPAMRERFDREARAIALLSHPNICTLHDIGHHEGTAFLVMEYLEGETLAERLSRQKPRSSAGSHAGPPPAPRTPRPPTPGDAGRGPASRAPLPLDETLRIATQLADALTTAHRAGIVHRDLKPGNVMLTRTGVKVLDFGLAKLKPSGDVGVNAASTMTDLPLTGDGMLVGTIPYMAPEQLEGRGIDHRTDIFAFGGIVYEMATGHRAFGGESQASLIAAILDREPAPISSDQPLTPPGLERLVRKCLAKDPDGRWQAASDIADELRWLSTGGGTVPVGPASGSPRRLRGWAVAAGVVLLAAVATAVVWRWWPRVTPHAPRREMTYTQATFAGDVSAAALSPDGRTVAYATGAEGDARVFVRDLTGGQSLEIWKGAVAVRLGWLPNGSQLMIASLADARSLPALWLVSRFGGTPRLVTTPGAYFAFSPDGSQLAHALPGVVGFSVSTVDGTRTREVRLQGFRYLYGLEWNAPANRIALLTIDDKDAYTVWSVTPEGNDVRRVYSDAAAISALCSSPSAGVLYLFRERQGGKQLVKVPLAGAPEPAATVLTSGLQMVSFQDFPICSISDDGQRLLYVRETGHANLWRLDLRRAASTPTALTRGTSNLGLPTVSPDGRWIVASETSGSSRRIVRLPVMGGEFAELTAGGGASFSPDGARLAFVRGPQRVWVSDADGRAAQQVKDAEAGPNDFVTWFPDGRLAWQTSDVRNYRIRDLASGHDELLVKNPEVGWIFEPTFSPQGDQVAVFWNRIDGPQQRRGLWVLSWPSREARLIAPDFVPFGWSEDSDWIYAFEHSMSTIVRVSPRTTKIEPLGSFPRGHLFAKSCSLTPDRQATVCSLYESVADAWIVDHFDPDTQGERR